MEQMPRFPGAFEGLYVPIHPYFGYEMGGDVSPDRSETNMGSRAKITRQSDDNLIALWQP